MSPQNGNGYSARNFRGASQTQQFTRGGNPLGINPGNLPMENNRNMQLEIQTPNSIQIFNMAGGIVNVNMYTQGIPDINNNMVRRNRNFAIPEQPTANQNSMGTFNVLPPRNGAHSRVNSPGSSSACGSDCTYCNSLGSDEPESGPFWDNVETFEHPTTSPFQNPRPQQ